MSWKHGSSSSQPEVLFCNPVPDDLTCGICMGACADPYVTVECGHLFCKECLMRAMESKKECPICRKSVGADEVRKDVRTHRKIMGLEVHCRYRSSGGCNWKGAYSDSEQHGDKCEHAMIPCPFMSHGCDAILTKKTLSEHITTNMPQHLLLTSSVVSRVQEDLLAATQELEILQRHDQRFIWVIPSFTTRRGPLYSRKFTSKKNQWYLGVDFEGPEQHAGVYLFAEGHSKRVDFKLILFNQDPRKDKRHLVNDWAPDYKGKGWGPLKFIDRSNLGSTGFLVNGCVRIAAELDSDPFD